MRELKKWSRIDEISGIFRDPLILSQILLKQETIIASKKSSFHEFSKNLLENSIMNAKDKKLTYFTSKSIDEKLLIRGLTFGNTIVALVLEDTRSGSEYLGSAAYDNLVREIYVQNPVFRFSLGRVDFSILPSDLKNLVMKEVVETKLNEIPEVWIGRYIYDIHIDQMISDKGAYMYVFLGRDKFNKVYAVKVIRDKTVDNKPLAVNGDETSIYEVMRSFLNSLEASLITKNVLRKSLVRFGYDDTYADKLLFYRKYISRPRAMILLKNTYTVEEYVETPPVILEDYADLGDLAGRVSRGCLNYRESLFLIVRLSGALAIIHLLRLLHMDIKPQNILLVKDDSENYGYAPLLGDFVGLAHLHDSKTELKKVTPEYADPVSLLKGEAGFDYDVYSLGATMYYALTGRKIRGRVLMNMVILKNLYGMSVPIKYYLLENTDMVPYLNRIEAIVNRYRNKEIRLNEAVEDLSRFTDEIDEAEIRESLKNVPEEYVSVLRKTIDINEKNRYSDSFPLWLNIVDVIDKLGLSNLLPTQNAL